MVFEVCMKNAKSAILIIEATDGNAPESYHNILLIIVTHCPKHLFDTRQQRACTCSSSSGATAPFFAHNLSVGASKNRRFDDEKTTMTSSNLKRRVLPLVDVVDVLSVTDVLLNNLDISIECCIAKLQATVVRHADESFHAAVELS